ncbi:hypothetical protein ACPA9J_27315 [Pseudomonas aeruginosa]
MRSDRQVWFNSARRPAHPADRLEGGSRLAVEQTGEQAPASSAAEFHRPPSPSSGDRAPRCRRCMDHRPTAPPCAPTQARLAVRSSLRSEQVTDQHFFRQGFQLGIEIEPMPADGSPGPHRVAPGSARSHPDRGGQGHPRAGAKAACLAPAAPSPR